MQLFNGDTVRVRDRDRVSFVLRLFRAKILANSTQILIFPFHYESTTSCEQGTCCQNKAAQSVTMTFLPVACHSVKIILEHFSSSWAANHSQISARTLFLGEKVWNPHKCERHKTKTETCFRRYQPSSGFCSANHRHPKVNLKCSVSDLSGRS